MLGGLRSLIAVAATWPNYTRIAGDKLNQQAGITRGKLNQQARSTGAGYQKANRMETPIPCGTAGVPQTAGRTTPLQLALLTKDSTKTYPPIYIPEHAP